MRDKDSPHIFEGGELKFLGGCESNSIIPLRGLTFIDNGDDINIDFTTHFAHECFPIKKGLLSNTRA